MSLDFSAQTVTPSEALGVSEGLIEISTTVSVERPPPIDGALMSMWVPS